MAEGLPIDDELAPIYTVGQVADMLKVQPAFLRRLDAESVVQPSRSAGGQRRYSRAEIVAIDRVVTLSGDGCTLAGIRKIFELEAQVAELERQLERERARRGS